MLREHNLPTQHYNNLCAVTVELLNYECESADENKIVRSFSLLVRLRLFSALFSLALHILLAARAADVITWRRAHTHPICGPALVSLPNKQLGSPKWGFKRATNLKVLMTSASKEPVSVLSEECLASELIVAQNAVDWHCSDYGAAHNFSKERLALISFSLHRKNDVPPVHCVGRYKLICVSQLYSSIPVKGYLIPHYQNMWIQLNEICSLKLIIMLKCTMEWQVWNRSVKPSMWQHNYIRFVCLSCGLINNLLSIYRYYF